MKKYAGLYFLMTPSLAAASNFGDLPRVLPLIWLALIISFFIALAKASKPVEDGSKKKFMFLTYLLYQALGVFLSFVLLVVLWMGTL